MATYEDDRSCGGKMVTKNRPRRFNPYERPLPPQPTPPTTSSNWFSGVILPASRKIASGALNIISSVFDSSDDESSGDSTCDDEDYEGNDPDGVDEANLETRTSNKELQLIEKSERKHAIEDLLMEETFSREESERLINIINSRVVTSDRPSDAIPGNDSLELCEKAVTEVARNWIREIKSGQSPELGTPGAYSARLQRIESKVASPVDVAKYHMNTRPPWASPSVDYVQTPLMLLRDGSGDLSSQSKRKNSLAFGSWNIHEELRKVRSKATETLLLTHSSAQVDDESSPYALALEGDKSNKSHGKQVQLDNNNTGERFADTNLGSENGYSEKEVKETSQDANGLPSSQASLSNDEAGKERGINVTEKCVFLSETYVEVPSGHENSSQNSHEEQLSQELSQSQSQSQEQTGTTRVRRQRKSSTPTPNPNPSRVSTRRAGVRVTRASK